MKCTAVLVAVAGGLAISALSPAVAAADTVTTTVSTVCQFDPEPLTSVTDMGGALNGVRTVCETTRFTTTMGDTPTCWYDGYLRLGGTATITIYWNYYAGNAVAPSLNGVSVPLEAADVVHPGARVLYSQAYGHREPIYQTLGPC